MDPDLFFVVGFVLGVLAIPAIASAFLDGRAPRLPAYLFIIGGLMTLPSGLYKIKLTGTTSRGPSPVRKRAVKKGFFPSNE